MSAALGYLIWCTTRNRLARQLARLRQPRYAVAVIVGLAYFGFIFSTGFAGGGDGVDDEPGTTRMAITALATITFVLVAGYWWFRLAVRGSLAFDPAEVQLLFPAPLSRRSLLGYRIVRTQVVVLVNALLWTFILRRGGDGGLADPLRFLSAWAFFSVPSLHRMGIALTIVEPRTPARRSLLVLGRLAAAGALAVLVGAGVGSWPEMAGTDLPGKLRVLRTALESGLAATALAPFRALLAPFLAGSPVEWLPAFGVLLGVIALHLVWVLGMRVPFEEAATQASDERAALLAALRSRGGAGVRPARKRSPGRHWLPLASSGAPAVAIAWKNSLSMLRGGSLRGIAFSVALMTVMALVLNGILGDQAPGLGLMPLGAMLVVSITAGPRMLRNDLRQDLLHLELLKTWPVSGFAAVLAEMTSPVVLLTVAQLGIVVVAAALTPPQLWAQVTASGHLGTLMLLPLVLLTINAVNLALQNAAALLFPSWTRLGTGSAGIEAMGQGILMTLGMVLALLVALLPAVVEIAVVVVVTTPFLGSYAVTLAVALGALVLLAETGWLVGRLGKLLERTEPSALI